MNGTKVEPGDCSLRVDEAGHHHRCRMVRCPCPGDVPEADDREAPGKKRFSDIAWKPSLSMSTMYVVPEPPTINRQDKKYT